MKTLALPLISLTLFSGCTDPEQEPEGTITTAELIRSGTRIQARLGLTDDGSTELLGWHDADLDTPCAFLKAEDGTSR